MDQENNQAALVERQRKKSLLQLIGCALAAVAGSAILIWLQSHSDRYFDFYQAYIVGVGIGLLVFGIGAGIKTVLLLKNKAKLAEYAANKEERLAERINEKAMAIAFKLFFAVMIVALIFIGEFYSYSGFVVCLFSLVFAYLCYFFVWLFLKKRMK